MRTARRFGSTRFAASRIAAAVAAIGVIALAGCVPHPPPELPDPIISCDTFGGAIAYDPPASNAGVDVTITSDEATISDCTPNTATLTYAAAMTNVVAVLPGFTCGPQFSGELLGSGSGRITWDDGAVTYVSFDVVTTSSAGTWDLDMAFTKGRWKGATAEVRVAVVSSVGDCVFQPVTSAALTNTTPFVVHP